MIDIFVSYSHRDEELRDELGRHLKALEREGLVSVWHDRKIRAGDNFGDVIDRNLNSASIVLLLISPDFVSSEYCWTNEMRIALERHETGNARVIPIVLRPTDWQTGPLGHLLALPRDGKPVTTWNNKDLAFYEIVKDLRTAINELSDSGPMSSETLSFPMHGISVQSRTLRA